MNSNEVSYACTVNNDFFDSTDIKEVLGTGKYANVMRVVSKKLTSALKKYKHTEKAKFEKEVENFKKIGYHKHIVKFFSAFEVDGYGKYNGFYIQMEYCSKGELTNIFKDPQGQKYTERHVKKIIYQTVKALVFMKKKGVLHRDIKPGNILVRSFEPVNIALADMNLSKVFDINGPETVCKTTLGTYNYVAPEVLVSKARNDNKYSYKCDVWSLGIVMYELLSGGEKPFQVSELKKHTILNKHKTKSKKEKAVQKLKFREGVKYGLEFNPPEAWTNVSSSAMKLLKRMLLIKPFKERASYEEILESSWIKERIDKSLLCPLFYKHE